MAEEIEKPSFSVDDQGERILERQRSWLEHFFTDARYNATLAAKKAGYSHNSAHDTGTDLRKRFAAEIDAHFAANTMPEDEILHRLADIARGPGEYIRTTKWNDETEMEIETVPWVDMDAIKADGASHLIKSVKYTANGVNIEFRDPDAAIDKLMRYKGMYNDKVAVTVTDDARLDEIRARIAALQEKGETAG